MQPWGEFVGRRRLLVLIVSLLVVAAAAAYGAGVFGSLSNGGYFVRDSDSYRVAERVREAFPTTPVDLVVIYTSPKAQVTDPAYAGAVQDVIDRVHRREPGITVRSWYDTRAPALISADQQATELLLTFPVADEEAGLEIYRAIREDLRAEGLSTHVGGLYALYDDVNSQVEEDIARAESIAVPLVLLLSLWIFGSIAAALMPSLVGGVAVAGAFAVVRLLSQVTEVSVFAINVITLLGMGLAIDYALFIVSRFREELARTDAAADVPAALGRTMATAGRTVFFSGVIVAASLSSLLLFPLAFLRSMGYGGMAAVLVAMTASLTVLPAVLALLGRRLEWGRVRGRRAAGRHSRDRQGWANVAHSVMRRPLLYVVVIGVGLALLGGPMLHARFGAVDERTLPVDAPSRATAALHHELFGGETSTADVLVVPAESGGASSDATAPRLDLAALQTTLSAVDGVEAVLAVGTNPAGRTSLVQVSWTGNGQTEPSQDLVRRLRDVPAPAGWRIMVGGDTASTVDLIDAVAAQLPLMAAVVAGVMLVLLFIAFGSLVLPVKAILMNTVSIAASFGAVTWIFQDGHLAGLLDFDPEGFLDATQPILMLAVLFGLSMDYEVFLLSRIREEWDASHDNVRAVAAGLQHTGRIITSAALLLAVVIAGFATSDIVMIKMIGVGMLVAVLLDATVVRALLVPATMRLLGRGNWWAPAPLARWWERHGHGRRAAQATAAPAGLE